MMVVVLNLPFKAKPFGDTNSFFDESKNLAFYLKGEIGFENVTLTKAPAPVFIYTPVFLLTSDNPSDNDLWYRGVAINFILITISLMLIYRAAISFFGKKIGLIAFFLFFLFPIHFYYVFGITAEVPAFFASAIIVYSWSKIYSNSIKISNWILFGFGLWLLIMCRPNTLLILVLGFLVLLYSNLKSRDFYNEFGRKLFLTITLCGVVCFSTLQLAKLFNSGKKVNNQEWLFYYVAHQGRYQFREEPLDFRFWDDSQRPDSKDYINWKVKAEDLEKIQQNTGKSTTDVYREYLIDDVIENPFITIRQFFVKSFFGQVYIVNSITPQKFHIGPFSGPLFYWLFLVLVNFINILIVVGLFMFLFKTKNLIKYWPLWSILLALIIFHGMMYMEPRYMYPARPAIFILGAAGLYQFSIVKKYIDKLSRIMQ